MKAERRDSVPRDISDAHEAAADSAVLDRAEVYLEGLINLERHPELSSARLTLEPVGELLERLGNPQHRLSVMHVAGSKGKGSTCLFAEAILQSAGERVGTFTSPHLERWTERFRIDGAEVAPRRLAEAVEKLKPHVEFLRKNSRTRPSFFDATTAAAFLLFAEANVDRAVIEVGLGGRLDSTNVVSPGVTCITNIELEHTDKLGETVEAIAGEKAGILKPGVPCVMGPLPEEAAEVVRDRASELGSHLEEYGVDFEMRAEEQELAGSGGLRPIRWEYRAADGFSVKGEIGTRGRHQLVNAALAISCVRRLDRHDDIQVAKAVQLALPGVLLPGRVEVLCREPWIVVDSAHTAVSAEALALALNGLPAGPRHLVLSISADKDLDAILSSLLPGAAHVTLTRAEPRRSLGLELLAEAVGRYGIADVKLCEDPATAVRRARARLAENDLLCVTGSIYMAGIARGILVDHSRRVSSRETS